MLESLEQADADLDKLCKTLLRTYSGIYDQPVSISEKQIASLVKCSLEEIQTQLQNLQHSGIIQYFPQKENPQLFFPIPRIRAEDLVINQTNLLSRKKQYLERLQAMLGYAENQKDCRSQAIAIYFGDLSTTPCGTCDNCLRIKKQSITAADFEEIKIAVMRLLEKQSLAPSAMISLLKNKNEAQVMKVLDFLQAEEMIQVNTDGTVSLC